MGWERWDVGEVGCERCVGWRGVGGEVGCGRGWVWGKWGVGEV